MEGLITHGNSIVNVVGASLTDLLFLYFNEFLRHIIEILINFNIAY